jgi:putative nucleotidyltransferase with HDIG domain
MVLTIAYNPPFALFMSVCLAILLALSQGTDLVPLLVQLGGLGTAVLAIRQVRTRTRPVEVGVTAGAAFAVMTVAAEVLAGQTARLVAIDATRNFLAAVFAGCVLTGCLHLVERAFGVVTDVTLLELADSSHPLLQELIRRAPGTYTHSMTVATLAEAAAEAVGANHLLTRVGCYYHDIGKMLKPHYFVENQSGANAHDGLGPALSTLIIIGHVKDGVALAEQYRLPRPVVDLVRQHHGTTLVEYFYREAVRQGGDGSADGLEPTFRYPGPKPQTREACILMLADAAEGAGRALAVPTPTALRKLVHDLTMRRLLDGQFDESGLTLSDLKRIEEAIGKGLIAVYHARIRYADEPAKAG